MLTYEGRPVYAVQEISPKDFASEEQYRFLAGNCVQVHIDVRGGREWVVVDRDNLKVVENPCTTIMKRQVPARFETVVDQVEHYIVMLIDLPVQSLAQVEEVLNMMKLFVGITAEEETEVMARCRRRWIY